MDELLNLLNDTHQEYFHQLTIELIQAGLSDQEIKQTLSQFLPLLTQIQEEGNIAFETLGQPKDYQEILSTVANQEHSLEEVTSENETVESDEDYVETSISEDNSEDNRDANKEDTSLSAQKTEDDDLPSNQEIILEDDSLSDKDFLPTSEENLMPNSETSLETLSESDQTADSITEEASSSVSDSNSESLSESINDTPISEESTLSTSIFDSETTTESTIEVLSVTNTTVETLSEEQDEAQSQTSEIQSESETQHHYTMEEIKKRYGSQTDNSENDDSILIATPKEKAKLTKKNQEKTNKNDNPLLVWIDYSLFVLSMIGFLTSILHAMSPLAPNFRLTTLIIMSFYGAGVIYASYMIWSPSHRKNSNETSFLAKISKIALIIILFTVWIVIVNLVNLLPDLFNAPLSLSMTLSIAIIAAILKIVLKKRFKIDSPF